MSTSPSPEKCTVAVVVRDRFSTTHRALDAILKNTPEPYDLIVVMGGVPAGLRRSLEEKYSPKARFFFEERLLNQAEIRNIALREAKTPLTAIVDNDTYVRPDWLPPLIRCLHDTGAGLVIPLILEAAARIHCAGNDLFITHKNGVAYGQHTLRCYGLTYYKGSNLKRSPIDYGEMHCQLVQTGPALRLGIFDEHLHEQSEVDSGLMWAKNGYPMWFEPLSVVQYDIPGRIVRFEDIRPYRFKWDIPLTIRSMEYFKKKWGMDITEAGTWEDFSVFWNRKVGLFSRLFPSRASLLLDKSIHGLGGIGGLAKGWTRGLKKRLAGGHLWKGYDKR